MLVFSLLTLIKSKYNRGFYYLLWIIMLLIAGLRYNVGTDYKNYERSFLNFEFWFSDTAFIWITKVIKYLGFSVQGYFFVIALLIQVLIFKSLKKYTTDFRTFLLSVFFFITLYYFNNSMNTLRQFIAIGIFLLNIENIINRKFLRYNMLFIIMFLFHTSSIIFYPLYFLYKSLNPFIRNAKYMNIILIVSFLLMFVKFDKVIEGLILKYGESFNYTYYATWGADSYLKYDLSWQLLVVLITKFILSLWIVNNKQKFIYNKRDEVLFSIFFIGLVLTFPLYPMLIFRRLLFYINIIEVIIYAMFAKEKSINFYVFVIYSIIFYIVNLLAGFATPLPYTIRIF